MVNIKLSETERLVSDEFQYIYQVNTPYQGHKENWVSKWFYVDINHALTDLASYYTRMGDSSTIVELLKENNKRLKELNKLYSEAVGA